MTLAQIHYKAGRYDEAKAMIDDAVKTIGFSFNHLYALMEFGSGKYITDNLHRKLDINLRESLDWYLKSM